MKYLSLFSGIGGFEIGIHSALNSECIGYSEIDPYPLSIYRKHFPNHPYLGLVQNINNLPHFDLLVGGSPCQNFSISNIENLGLEGKQSGLLKEAVRILRESKPKYFVIENVASMKQKNKDAISELLGVQPVLLNAADVSCQTRKRLFWANFPIDPLPKLNHKLIDILEDDYDPKLILSEREVAFMDRKVPDGRDHWDFGYHHDTAKNKAHCLLANLHKGVPYNVLIDRRKGIVYRKLSPLEAERIMGFDDDWTKYSDQNKLISNSRRWKSLGNAVSIPVMKHIFQCLKRVT